MSTSHESVTAEPRPPAGPAADDAPIPLPPPPKSPAIQAEPGLGRRLAWLDGVLWVLVLVLAFLLGSFVATNSDLWLHLALGRDLLAGTYHFGVDPYSFTTEGVYWVNHSWLFDVLLYGLYSLLGGAGVVVLKALLVALTVGLLAALRRPEQSAWLPLCCAALAVLVMSPRLLLQPSLLSYLFLALTLFVLVRTSPRDVGTPARLSLWWLVPVFVVWANVDHWFWLGPVTVGLFTLGEWLQDRFPLGQAAAPLPPGRLKALAAVLGVGVLACVLNPHHVYVFTLPPELAQLVAGLPLPADFVAGGLALNRFQEYDPQHLRFYGMSPLNFQGDYYLPSSLGKTVAGLAFFPLLLLGVGSFALSLRVGALRYWRVLVWAALALLSLLQSRLIPYFAVAAAPITALNLQDFAFRWAEGNLRLPRGWLIGGRLLTALLLAGLAVLAWPGWLNTSTPTLRSPRRVAWRFEEDPSLRQAALALGALHKTGQLKNGFNYAAEVAHHAVWHVPGYKDYFDSRFDLFAAQAESASKIRRDFQEESKSFNTRGVVKGEGTWRRVFRERQINYVILTNPDLFRAHALARRFYLDPKQEWALFYDDGRTAIVGWRGPRGAEEFAGLPQPLTRDARAEAFGPPPVGGSPARAEVNTPQPVWFWWDYLNGLPGQPLAYGEAMQHLLYYNEDGAPLWAAWYDEIFRRNAFQSPWTLSAFPGPALTLGIGAGGVLPAGAGLLSSFFAQVIPNGGDDRGPVAHPYLALRKARRALAQDPNDPACYMALARAYAALAQAEDYWRGQPRPVTEFSLMELRGVQIMAALNFALDLQPDNVEARQMLAQLYLSSHLLDAALEQLTELRLSVERRRAQGELLDAKQFEQVQKNVEQTYKAVAAEVSARRNSYLLKAERLDPARKFFAAMVEPYRFQGPKGEPQQDQRGRGLVLEAVKALRTADRGKLKEDEREAIDARLVDLLLRMGKFRDMVEVPDSKHVLEATQSSPRLLGLYQPAVGNYAEADKVLEILEKKYARDEKTFALLAGEVLGNIMLTNETPNNPLRPLVTGLRQQTAATKAGELRAELKRRTDLMLLRGIVALEQGDTDKALAQLRGFLRLTGRGDTFEDRRAAEAVFPDRRIAERLVRLMEAQR